MTSSRTSRWRKSGDALMKPFDPRLLRAVPSARRPVAALAAMGVAAGVATIATAFALTGLVVAVVDDRPLGPPAAWLAALFVARAILAWATEVVAAWAGVSVSTALRAALVRAWGPDGPGARPEQSAAVSLATAGAIWSAKIRSIQRRIRRTSATSGD